MSQSEIVYPQCCGFKKKDFQTFNFTPKVLQRELNRSNLNIIPGTLPNDGVVNSWLSSTRFT